MAQFQTVMQRYEGMCEEYRRKEGLLADMCKDCPLYELSEKYNACLFALTEDPFGFERAVMSKCGNAVKGEGKVDA